ncbi:MAG: hypothetical protein PV344_04490, partial [Anaplasma sp.]|nr:hypothetical protein [Anaplasma sp.]
VQISNLQKIISDKGITISLHQGAKSWLVKHGYDVAYGARLLKRLIQQHIQNQLACLLLGDKIKEGSKLVVFEENNSLVIKEAT